MTSRLHFRRRSLAGSVRFLGKAASLLAFFMSVIHVGYIFATHRLDHLVEAVNTPGYLQNTGVFVFLRESAIIPAVAIVMLALVVLLLGHYLVFGPKEAVGGKDDEALPWWSMTERVNHAVVAVTFLVLLFSGLLITFGRWVSPGAAGVYIRQAHEYAGFAFTPFFLFMLIKWVREALPRRYDWAWLRHLGGYLGYKGSLEAGKLNAGQKIWYWVLLLGGGVLLVTGFGLFFGLGNAAAFRLYVVAHFFAAVPVILMFLVHLYMSTVGVRGVWRTMWDGKLSRAMAQEYHSRAADLSTVKTS